MRDEKEMMEAKRGKMSDHSFFVPVHSSFLIPAFRLSSQIGAKLRVGK